MSDAMADAQTAADFLQRLMQTHRSDLNKAVHVDVWATRNTIISLASTLAAKDARIARLEVELEQWQEITGCTLEEYCSDD